MLEDKLRHSDWDATCDAIEEAVARESYLSWLKENERRTRSGVKHSASQVREDGYAQNSFSVLAFHELGQISDKLHVSAWCSIFLWVVVTGQTCFDGVKCSFVISIWC